MDFDTDVAWQARVRFGGIGKWIVAALVGVLPGLAVAAGPPSSTVPPLLGTVVGAQEDSYALFGAGEAFFWVREGGQIKSGLQLLHVYSNHATIRHDGTGQELQVDLGSGGSFESRRSPPPAPPLRSEPGVKYRASDLQAMTPQQLEILNQQIRERFEGARAADSARGRKNWLRGRRREGTPEE